MQVDSEIGVEFVQFIDAKINSLAASRSEVEREAARRIDDIDRQINAALAMKSQIKPDGIVKVAMVGQSVIPLAVASGYIAVESTEQNDEPATNPKRPRAGIKLIEPSAQPHVREVMRELVKQLGGKDALATAIDFSPSHIGNAMNGSKPVSRRLARSLAGYLGCTLHELIRGKVVLTAK